MEVVLTPGLGTRTVRLTLPSYVSCTTDNTNSRALYGKATASSDMTELMCVEFCDDNNFAYGKSRLDLQCDKHYFTALANPV